MSVRRVLDLILLVLAVVVGIYFIADDTPEAWLVRVSWAAAIVAGVGVLFAALHRLSGRP